MSPMTTFRYSRMVLALQALLLASVQAVGGFCAPLVHGSFYDLGALEKPTDYTLDVDNLEGTIYFNMCTYTKFKCNSTTEAYAVYKEGDKCVPLTMKTYGSGYNASVVALPNERKALSLAFAGVQLYDGPLADGNSLYNVEFLLECDEAAEAFAWGTEATVFSPKNASFLVHGRGRRACPSYNASFLVDFFDKFSFLTAVLAIAGGLVQCFYGYKLYKPTLFAIGFFFGFVTVLLFLFGIWTGQDSPAYKGWVILAFAAVAGLGAGFLVSAVAWVGLVVSGAVLGFFLAMIAYTLFLYGIVSHPSVLLLYNVLFVGMLAGAICGYEFQEIILILTCGIGGAYLTIRGCSVFFGGYPNEFEIADRIKSGRDSGVTYTFYVYMVFMAILAVGGIWYQKKLKHKDNIAEQGNEYLRTLVGK
jgi:hypothetical protein